MNRSELFQHPHPNGNQTHSFQRPDVFHTYIEPTQSRTNLGIYKDLESSYDSQVLTHQGLTINQLTPLYPHVPHPMYHQVYWVLPREATRLEDSATSWETLTPELLQKIEKIVHHYQAEHPNYRAYLNVTSDISPSLATLKIKSLYPNKIAGRYLQSQRQFAHLHVVEQLRPPHLDLVPGYPPIELRKPGSFPVSAILHNLQMQDVWKYFAEEIAELPGTAVFLPQTVEGVEYARPFKGFDDLHHALAALSQIKSHLESYWSYFLYGMLSRNGHHPWKVYTDLPSFNLVFPSQLDHKDKDLNRRIYLSIAPLIGPFETFHPNGLWLQRLANPVG